MRCGLCGAGGPLPARLSFEAAIGGTQHVASRPTKGVPEPHTVALALALCEPCTRRAYKHLKRMTRRSHFRVHVDGRADAA